ncbi:MAG: polyprenyl synthetase family protein [Anaerolineales bacterium]|nr:polyprenyl synthetase family protein [Anaerolineales bacterium]
MSTNFFSLVEADILRVEARMRGREPGRQPDLQAAIEHLLGSGGKRIRPVLALLTGRMLGGDRQRLITLAAAIELLHTATLVHDDLIDGSLLRRGIPTINAEWTPAATVLAGDYIFARAARLAAETDSVAVMQLFAETLATIVSGEITQMFSSRGISNRENYDERIYAKTASMFVLATRAAAILSGGEEQTIQAMHQYGYQVGMAFQVIDDILDFTGEQATVGKPVASDLRQGLVTLPAIYYHEAHPEDGDLQAVLRGEYLSNSQIERLVNAIRSSGAVQAAFDEARQSIERATQALGELPEGVEWQALHELAQYTVDREI